ncbi:hypothetical protein MRS44_012983 [Fusarium solani]|uniref:uncharacterized protein n=1 Tax=Fusarium solani TaxID=169388 RepID=UPI0032C417C6|nr:hypothetical protein MRS44_012983 [Fusarium solani]
MANIDKRTGPDAKVSVEIDPSAPGTIVRIVLAAESVFNVFLAIPMIFDAKEALVRMYLSDGKSAAPHAASIFQLFGISLVAMTIPMVLAIPNKPGAIETRRTTYQMLGSFEALALPLSFWQVQEVRIGGPGHLAIQYAAKMEAEVVVYSTTPSKESEAQELGATAFHLISEMFDKKAAPIDVLVVAGSKYPDWEKYE